MNAVVVQLTARELLGRGRAVVLVLLPLLLLGLSVLARQNDANDDVRLLIMDQLALGLVVPLLGLVLGTGAIASEIDDGSIMYLLAKPLSRHTIATSKAIVAATAAVLVTAVPTWIAAALLGFEATVAAGFALAAALAAFCYAAVFVLVSVVSRNAVVYGLLYAVIWEGTVGGFVPGARALSIRQWALGVAEGAMGQRAPAQIDAAVGAWTGGLLLAGVTIGAIWYAGRLLRTLRISGDD